MAMEPMDVKPDVRVTDHGTLWLFEAYTSEVHAWFQEHTEAQRLCNSYAVEWRFASRIIDALREEGFDVCCSVP